MRHQFLLLAALIGLVSCQNQEREEARPADFERMVIIQDDQDGANMVGSDDERDVKIR